MTNILSALSEFPIKPPPAFIYRIRRRSDGKYSTGTSSPKWTKNGKFFPNYQAVQSHLLWFLAGPAYYDFEATCELTANTNQIQQTTHLRSTKSSCTK